MPVQSNPSSSTNRVAKLEGAAPPGFLGQLAPEDCTSLTGMGRPVQYAQGEFVFSAGSPGKTVYFLRSGKIKIGQFSQTGREVILWFCLVGEMFGLAEVARGGRRGVHAQACEDSELLAVSQENFKDFLAVRPHAALLSMELLATRLRVLGDIFMNLVTDNVDTRIVKLILRLSEQYGRRNGKEILLAIPLTHQEIANMVGATRQSVTSSLGKLRRQGVLSMENHRIIIESEKFLSEMAQGGTIAAGRSARV